MKQQMKKIMGLLILIILLIVNLNNITYADSNDETMQEQQEEFGIQEFLQNAKNYTGDFFEDIDNYRF